MKVKCFPPPLSIKLLQIIGYSKHSNNINKYMNLLGNDKKLLKKYNKIWDKITSLFKKEFNRKPVYTNKFINTKIKIYNDVMHANFQYNKISKDSKHCKYLTIAPINDECYAYLSTISLDSILVSSNNKYYPQIFLEKCSYAVNMKALNTIAKALVLEKSDVDLTISKTKYKISIFTLY